MDGPLDVAVARARRGNVDYAFLFARTYGDQLEQVGELIVAQRIQPVIDKVFAFEQASDALTCLAQSRAKGKVVVQMR